MFGHELPDGVGALDGIGDIAAQQHRRATGVADLIGHIGGSFGTTNTDAHHRSGASHGDCHAATNTSGRAGDEHHLTLEHPGVHGSITVPRSAMRNAPVTA
ncbi:unannotated protein [freshwater metagenome]|uniref:Unannotated protein n=1 Tax=freshwater metagenome TaxID=449393 RepID=A0A6J5YJA5_9ZZZZ